MAKVLVPLADGCEELEAVTLIDLLRRSIQRQGNQLRAILFRVYPQALGLFGKLTAHISLHFLMAFPSAQEAQALSLPAFEAFCREHRYSRPALISRRYAHLMDPAPEANPIAVVAHRDQIRILAELLLPQVQRRVEALSSLAHLFSQHPDAFLFDSLPGVGELLAPALLYRKYLEDKREKAGVTVKSVGIPGHTIVYAEGGAGEPVILFHRTAEIQQKGRIQSY